MCTLIGLLQEQLLGVHVHITVLVPAACLIIIMVQLACAGLEMSHDILFLEVQQDVP